eukprot:CAMPEP_0178779978 /NCGR_PEP_ID=MMETSP0745-20121128/1812_1 /TAXON_ID=913974 /ORGANISM="Nitzschia punctata, Strain CCMP561" /LENGTH=150 /DNA_ID=CAMNT_0020437203 /DNA_START=295 /DNA_END=747 /DNA_ORIENTATION=+
MELFLRLSPGGRSTAGRFLFEDSTTGEFSTTDALEPWTMLLVRAAAAERDLSDLGTLASEPPSISEADRFLEVLKLRFSFSRHSVEVGIDFLLETVTTGASFLILSTGVCSGVCAAGVLSGRDGILAFGVETSGFGGGSSSPFKTALACL